MVGMVDTSIQTYAVDVKRRPQAVSAVVFGDLNLTRCLDGVPVTVLSSDPNDVTFRSRYIRNTVVMPPVSDTEATLAALLRLGKTFPVKPVLFYGTDAVLLLISRNRERLSQYYRFLMPPKDMVECLVDKERFRKLATAAQLPVPATVSSYEFEDPEQIVRSTGLPCILKPNTHIDWFKLEGLFDAGPKKALRADNLGELRHWCKQLRSQTSDFVVQQFVEGGEEQIFSFHAYISERREIWGSFVGKKIRTYPKDAGVSTFLELVKEPMVERIALDTLAKLSFVGPVKIDLKRDARTGEFYVLELNARFNLWHHLGASNGVNLPKIAYDDLSGKPLHPARTYRTVARWLSFGNDLRSFARSYHPSGQLSFSQWVRSLQGHMVYDIFSWDDPAPFVAACQRYCRAAANRLSKASPKTRNFVPGFGPVKQEVPGGLGAKEASPHPEGAGAETGTDLWPVVRVDGI